MICEAAPALSSLPPHTHASSRLYRTSQWGGGSKQRRHEDEHTPAPPADVLSPRQRRGRVARPRRCGGYAGIGVSPLSALASRRLLGRLAQGRLTRDGGGGKSLYSRPASHQRARSSRRQAITRSAGADAVCRGHGVRSTNGLPGMASVLMPCVWPRRKGIKRSWMERVRRGLKASFCAQVAAANSHTDMQQTVSSSQARKPRD